MLMSAGTDVNAVCSSVLLPPRVLNIAFCLYSFTSNQPPPPDFTEALRPVVQSLRAAAEAQAAAAKAAAKAKAADY